MLRPSPNELERLKKEEFDRRRIQRWKEVREYSRKHADKLREAYKHQKRKVIEKVAKSIQENLSTQDVIEKDKLQKKLALQMEQMGSAHKQAANKGDVAAEQLIEAHANDIKARGRHKAALRYLLEKQREVLAVKLERIEHLKSVQLIEQQRARAIAALPAPTTDINMGYAEKNEALPRVKVCDQTRYAMMESYAAAANVSVTSRRDDGESDPTRENNGRHAAELRESEMTLEQRQQLINAEEQSIKALLRGHKALRKQTVSKDYAQLMSEMDQLYKQEMVSRHKQYQGPAYNVSHGEAPVVSAGQDVAHSGSMVSTGCTGALLTRAYKEKRRETAVENVVMDSLKDITNHNARRHDDTCEDQTPSDDPSHNILQLYERIKQHNIQENIPGAHPSRHPDVRTQSVDPLESSFHPSRQSQDITSGSTPSTRSRENEAPSTAEMKSNTKSSMELHRLEERVDSIDSRLYQVVAKETMRPTVIEKPDRLQNELSIYLDRQSLSSTDSSQSSKEESLGDMEHQLEMIREFQRQALQKLAGQVNISDLMHLEHCLSSLSLDSMSAASLYGSGFFITDRSHHPAGESTAAMPSHKGPDVTTPMFSGGDYGSYLDWLQPGHNTKDLFRGTDSVSCASSVSSVDLDVTITDIVSGSSLSIISSATCLDDTMVDSAVPRVMTKSPNAVGMHKPQEEHAIDLHHSHELPTADGSLSLTHVSGLNGPHQSSRILEENEGDSCGYSKYDYSTEFTKMDARIKSVPHSDQCMTHASRYRSDCTVPSSIEYLDLSTTMSIYNASTSAGQDPLHSSDLVASLSATNADISHYPSSASYTCTTFEQRSTQNSQHEEVALMTFSEPSSPLPCELRPVNPITPSDHEEPSVGTLIDLNCAQDQHISSSDLNTDITPNPLLTPSSSVITSTLLPGRMETLFGMLDISSIIGSNPTTRYIPSETSAEHTEDIHSTSQLLDNSMHNASQVHDNDIHSAGDVQSDCSNILSARKAQIMKDYFAANRDLLDQLNQLNCKGKELTDSESVDAQSYMTMAPAPESGRSVTVSKAGRGDSGAHSGGTTARTEGYWTEEEVDANSTSTAQAEHAASTVPTISGSNLVLVGSNQSLPRSPDVISRDLTCPDTAWDIGHADLTATCLTVDSSVSGAVISAAGNGQLPGQDGSELDGPEQQDVVSWSSASTSAPGLVLSLVSMQSYSSEEQLAFHMDDGASTSIEPQVSAVDSSSQSLASFIHNENMCLTPSCPQPQDRPQSSRDHMKEKLEEMKHKRLNRRSDDHVAPSTARAARPGGSPRNAANKNAVKHQIDNQEAKLRTEKLWSRCEEVQQLKKLQEKQARLKLNHDRRKSYSQSLRNKTQTK